MIKIGNKRVSKGNGTFSLRKTHNILKTISQIQHN